MKLTIDQEILSGGPSRLDAELVAGWRIVITLSGKKGRNESFDMYAHQARALGHALIAMAARADLATSR